jgi:outer membrane protein assembly factor BamB
MGGRRWGWAVAAAAALLAVSCGADPDLPAPGATRAGIDRCDWAMWGHDVDRSFSYPCRTALSPATAHDLKKRWFFNTADVVTATPAVVDDTVYVGDWSGTFYALRRDDGRPRWTYDTAIHENVYSGQIVSSPAVADVDGERTVFFGGGKTLYALAAGDGHLRWRHELRPDGGSQDPTEIETSPVVVDGMVIVGWDVHNDDGGEPAGVVALDAATGAVRWTFTTERTPQGCGDVWGSPSVDRSRGLVFAATGNCPSSPAGWGRYTEALFALDLRTGRPRWSFQPHRPNNDDFDFAGAPNLFEGRDGRALVGLGNKDATYYAVDRSTGREVWQRSVSRPGITRRGSNFSTGGFIGPTAYADGIVVGGTAVGGAPFLHALDAATGRIRWQQPEAAATYAAAVEANGVVIIGGTDFTLRALDLRTGRVLWRQEMTGVVAGGAVVVGNDVIAVAGIREPGVTEKSRTSGVTLFSLDAGPVIPTSTASTEATSSTTTSTTQPGAGPTQACVGAPCPFPFTLVEPPAGVHPTATLEVSLDPWTVTFHAEGLGAPEAWLRSGSRAAEDGADAYGLFMSERDDNPQGGVLCELDEHLSCTSHAIPKKGATYTRITLLAIRSGTGLPSVTEGVDRLVATRAFDDPVTP